jgi:hypothetical protein
MQNIWQLWTVLEKFLFCIILYTENHLTVLFFFAKNKLITIFLSVLFKIVADNNRTTMPWHLSHQKSEFIGYILKVGNDKQGHFYLPIDNRWPTLYCQSINRYQNMANSRRFRPTFVVHIVATIPQWSCCINYSILYVRVHTVFSRHSTLRVMREYGFV